MQQSIEGHSTDVAIVGAGPIGIELAVALRHAGVRHALIDAGNAGSTFTWWAPGTQHSCSSPVKLLTQRRPHASTS